MDSLFQKVTVDDIVKINYDSFVIYMFQNTIVHNYTGLDGVEYHFSNAKKGTGSYFDVTVSI